MRKLLSANYSRLFRNGLFWFCTAALLVISVLTMFNGCRQAALLELDESAAALEDYYFNLAPVIGLFLSVFLALFLGTEYSDGTMRNKLTVGHRRRDVYLANLLVCFTAGLFFLAAWLLGGLTGIPVFGLWQIGVQSAVLFMLVAVFFTAAFAGIFTLLSMLSTNRAVTAVLSILLFLGLLFAASYFYSALCEPEMYSDMIVTAEGIQVGEPAPNPYYISGFTRTLYEWILDFLPSGQSIRLANMVLVHPLRAIVSSVVILIGTTAAGLAAFRKKDLK